MKSRNLSRRPTSLQQKRREFLRWFRPWSKDLTTSRKLMFEPLEGRALLASLYVDNPGDYIITTDQGAAGLDNGDTVTFNPSGGTQLPQAGLIFGTTAFGTIQGAVNLASAGDTVNVGQGTFSELVNVNKQLFLKGNQVGVDGQAAARAAALPATETVVNGNAGTTSFFVTASGVVLDGFTVQDQTNVPQFGAGIVLGVGTNGSQVRNNIVQNNVVGL
ncbi:MAG: hypothetical protein K8R36_18190, partial [Planctomycetales bacterium]|nr:hypothetical protein [Planctomycetales bacterium]